MKKRYKIPLVIVFIAIASFLLMIGYQEYEITNRRNGPPIVFEFNSAIHDGETPASVPNYKFAIPAKFFPFTLDDSRPANYFRLNFYLPDYKSRSEVDFNSSTVDRNRVNVLVSNEVYSGPRH